MADPVNSNQDPANSNLDPAKDPGKQPDGNHSTVAELPEHLIGVYTKEEFSKLSDEGRQKMSEMGKRLHGDYTKKTQSVAELIRIKEQLDADPDKAAHVRKSMTEYDARKAGLLPDNKKPDEVDDFLKDADDKDKKAFELLDKRYKKPLEDSNKKISELESMIKDLVSGNNLTRSESLEKDLSDLSPGFKELGDKYREKIITLGTSRGGKNLSPRKLIQIVSDTDEYDRAVLMAGSDKKQIDKLKDNASSRANSTTPATETVELIRNKSRDPRFKQGSVDVPGVLSKVFEVVKRGMPS